MSDIEDYNSDSDNSSSSNSSSEIIVKKKIINKNPILDEDVEIEDPEVEEEEDQDNEFLDQDEDDEPEPESDEDEDEKDVDDIIMEGGAKKEKKEKKEKVPSEKKPPVVKAPIYLSDDDDDEEETDDHYLQKFDAELNKNYVVDFHPECSIHNYDEIAIFTHVVRDNNNNIIDDLHRTIPFLTKFEKARVLGQRAKQLSYPGTKPFVKVPENVIDGYIIAELELQQKKIPFIIRRPFPGGGSEYWNLRDLEIINF